MKKIVLSAFFMAGFFAANAQLNIEKLPEVRLQKPLDSSFFSRPQFDYRDLKNKDIIAKLAPKKNDIIIINPNLSGVVPMPNAYNKEKDISVKMSNAVGNSVLKP